MGDSCSFGSYSQLRAILCIHCGEAIRYIADDEESNKLALKQMLIHERLCVKNPLVIENTKLKNALVNIKHEILTALEDTE